MRGESASLENLRTMIQDYLRDYRQKIRKNAAKIGRSVGMLRAAIAVLSQRL